MTTTAQYRNAGHAAVNDLRFADAAEFYTRAADVYPAKGALADLDIAKLRRFAAACLEQASIEVPAEDDFNSVSSRHHY